MNILVTNFQNSGENVMIIVDSGKYPNITSKSIESALDLKKQEYEDVFSVEDKEVQYYIYDPCFLEESILDHLNKH